MFFLLNIWYSMQYTGCDFFLSNTWENMTKMIKCIIQAHSNSWQTFSHSCQREVSLKRCRWTWRDHEKETTASRNARSKLRRTQRNTAKELPGWLRMRGHPSYWGKRTVSRVGVTHMFPRHHQVALLTTKVPTTHMLTHTTTFLGLWQHLRGTGEGMKDRGF